MSLIEQVFGQTPFGPLVEHARKVRACVDLVRPLIDAALEANDEEVHRLQDEISRLEYEADEIKRDIREQLPRRFFLPVAREDIERYLKRQDKIADSIEDLAVILMIRKTRIHPELVEPFNALVEQVLHVTAIIMGASEELLNLAETSFTGAEAEQILACIQSLGEEEWKADRVQRRLSLRMYAMEDRIDPVTLFFYEKLLLALSRIANAADNAGDTLRVMIVKA